MGDIEVKAATSIVSGPKLHCLNLPSVIFIPSLRGRGPLTAALHQVSEPPTRWVGCVAVLSSNRL